MAKHAGLGSKRLSEVAFAGTCRARNYDALSRCYPCTVRETQKSILVESPVGGEINLDHGRSITEGRSADEPPCLAIGTVIPLGVDDMSHELVMGQRPVLSCFQESFKSSLHAVELEKTHLLKGCSIIHW
jgi:hypothetical protein